ECSCAPARRAFAARPLSISGLAYQPFADRTLVAPDGIENRDIAKHRPRLARPPACAVVEIALVGRDPSFVAAAARDGDHVEGKLLHGAGAFAEHLVYAVFGEMLERADGVRVVEAGVRIRQPGGVAHGEP